MQKHARSPFGRRCLSLTLTRRSPKSSACCSPEASLCSQSGAQADCQPADIARFLIALRLCRGKDGDDSPLFTLFPRVHAALGFNKSATPAAPVRPNFHLNDEKALKERCRKAGFNHIVMCGFSSSMRFSSERHCFCCRWHCPVIAEATDAERFVVGSIVSAVAASSKVSVRASLVIAMTGRARAAQRHECTLRRRQSQVQAGDGEGS